MKLPSSLPGRLLALLIIPISFPALADTVGPVTVAFPNLATGADALQPVSSTFTFPKFDASLGSLQSVDLAFTFAGTIAGSATDVNQSPFNSAIDHWVFFRLEDLSNNLTFAEPALHLTASIPPGQNATVLFGPEFQSTTLSFSVTPGDLRFAAWENGPGSVSGRLGVYFSNTTRDSQGLPHFFSGTDNGVYTGSFSVAYNFVPVPEPSSLLLSTVAVLLFVRRMSSKRPAQMTTDH